MWAVLALARLNEKIPSDFDSIHAFRLRNAIEDAIGAFCDEYMEATWSTLYSDRAWQIVSTLKRTAADYYRHTGDVQNPDAECEYLVELFSLFSMHVHQQEDRDFTEAYGALGMLAAVAIKMESILGHRISDMFDMFNNIYADENVSNDTIVIRTNQQIDLICATIEQFVREQLETNGAYTPVSEARDIVGQSFVRLIHEPLRQHVESVFRMLMNDLAFCSSHTVNKYQPDIKERVAMFYESLSRFFSYCSPLLSAFFLPDMSNDENELDEDEDEDENYQEHIPEHVANHDFSQYDDFDWHRREFEIFDVQDVLRGPEHADMDGVSIALSSTDSSCPLCADADTEMRKLNVCSHAICAICLDVQLKVQHECRYKCAICRAEFFPN